MKNNSYFKKPQSLSIPKKTVPKLFNKYKILYWADTPTVSTGFGTVSRHWLKGLHNTGRFDIDILGINYTGDFYDKTKFPYQIVSARSADNPQDVYGFNKFLSILSSDKQNYDLVVVMNDTFVVEQIMEKYREIREQKLYTNKKFPRLIYYYPVDCRVAPHFTSMIEVADGPVAYSQFAIEETKKVIDRADIKYIYCGIDSKTFIPLNREEQLHWRKTYLKIEDPETFIFINVGRNSRRKDIAKSICAFNEFHKEYPNSILYCHAAVRDSGAGSTDITDLSVPIQHLGITDGSVKFPNNFHPAIGFPDEILNRLYNCADAFITTHNGEGMGIPQFESMSAGIPIIVPDNTVIPELIGPNKNKGYVYPCKEVCYIDGSGIRRTGRIEDIVNSMIECYKERGTPQQKEIIDRAKVFSGRLDWEYINKEWIAYIDEVMIKEQKPIKVDKSGEVL